LAASTGLGRTTPAGGFGIGSAIILAWVQRKIRIRACQMLIRKRTGRSRVTCLPVSS
jgi:hypothetical protein